MKNISERYLTEEIFSQPILKSLSNLAVDSLGIGVLLVFPKEDGWGQVTPGGPQSYSDLCRVVQATKEGLKHCRMCHILMSVAACGNGAPTEQVCHAGASVLVVPVPVENQECFAVLSSCLFVANGGDPSWKAARARGEELGIDQAALKQAFDSLPKLGPRERERALAIMASVAEAVKLIQAHVHTARELDEARKRKSSATQVHEMVARELRTRAPGAVETRHATGGRPRCGAHGVVGIVADLVSRRPNLPYSVSEIAAAARMSPNHFSTLFSEHYKQGFSEFLTQKRMKVAEAELGDLTLSISEVARKAGYDDAGYFARRFRQEHGMSPSQWRQKIAASMDAK